MPANWEVLNQDLGGIGSALGQWAREKKAKEDAIQQIIAKAQIEQYIKQSDPYQMALTKMMEGFINPSKVIDTTAKDESGNVVGVNQNDFYMKPSFGPSGPSFSMEQTPQAHLSQKVKETEAVEQAKGLPSSEMGKVTLAQESIKNITDVINTLFPDGTPGSFNREFAFKSNLPMNRFPILGAFVPPSWPGHQQGQEIYRKMGASLSGRQLIQTGVAARPEETAKLVEQFAPNKFSNPKASLEGLLELRNFYIDYLKNLGSRGTKLGNVSSKISLPPKIKTTSQAVQYLVSQGMTKEEAVNWIRSQ